MLTLLSARIGTIAGRLGPRRFLVVGPMLMAAGAALVARMPADSAAWQARLATRRRSIPPPTSHRRPARGPRCSGSGISMVVAPLTSTLMGSIPARFSGLGSAINNSISRVGQPLLGAVIFIAVSATFYSVLGSHAPGLDTATQRSGTPSRRSTRRRSASAAERRRRRTPASIEAFHLAMLMSRRPARRRRPRVVVRAARAPAAGVENAARWMRPLPSRPRHPATDAVMPRTRNGPPWPGMTMSAASRTRARPGSIAAWSAPSGSISGVRSASHHRWVRA